MDEFYYKPTEMKGIIELGHIDPNYDISLNKVRSFQCKEGVGFFDGLKRFKDLLEFLKIKSIDFSYLNAQVYESACEWHRDGEEMIVCLGAKSDNLGTIFRMGDKEFQLKPWYVYWIQSDPEHIAVKSSEQRILYRFLVRK